MLEKRTFPNVSHTIVNVVNDLVEDKQNGTVSCFSMHRCDLQHTQRKMTQHWEDVRFKFNTESSLVLSHPHLFDWIHQKITLKSYNAIFSLDARRVVANFNPSHRAKSIAISHRWNVLLVMCYEANTIQFFNLQTKLWIKTVTLPLGYDAKPLTMCLMERYPPIQSCASDLFLFSNGSYLYKFNLESLLFERDGVLVWKSRVYGLLLEYFDVFLNVVLSRNEDNHMVLLSNGNTFMMYNRDGNLVKQFMTPNNLHIKCVQSNTISEDEPIVIFSHFLLRWVDIQTGMELRTLKLGKMKHQNDTQSPMNIYPNSLFLDRFGWIVVLDGDSHIYVYDGCGNLTVLIHNLVWRLKN